MSFSTDFESAVLLGYVDEANVEDPNPNDKRNRVQREPLGSGNKVDALALLINPPRVSQDVKAPVNNVSVNQVDFPSMPM